MFLKPQSDAEEELADEYFRFGNAMAYVINWDDEPEPETEIVALRGIGNAESEELTGLIEMIARTRPVITMHVHSDTFLQFYHRGFDLDVPHINTDTLGLTFKLVKLLPPSATGRIWSKLADSNDHEVIAVLNYIRRNKGWIKMKKTTI